MASEPITLAQAAKALGVTKEALRQRLKRGQAEGFRDNRGRWMVLLGESDRQGLAAATPSADELAIAKIQLARWQTMAEQLGERLADRDRELADLQAERDRLLTMIEDRPLWPAFRAWLRRFWRG